MIPAPTPAPAIAPPRAPNKIFPKSSPETISATMDMIASESPTPITAPSNIPFFHVNPNCFASIRPRPAPASAPPAIPSKMFPHVSSLLMIMSLILSMRSVKPTASISPPKRLSSLPRSGISESAMAQAASPAPISAMRGRIFSIHFWILSALSLRASPRKSYSGRSKSNSPTVPLPLPSESLGEMIFNSSIPTIAFFSFLAAFVASSRPSPISPTESLTSPSPE